MALQTQPTCRTMWMFPRNIRDVEPWKLSQILNLLLAADGCVGSQSIQNELYAQLERFKIKREKVDDGKGVSNQGGMRTYLAQLACLGLAYVDKDKRYLPTRAGQHVIDGENPAGVLRCQLLRLQYPSVYGWGTNVKISPKMRVKPFVFLIRLLRDPRMDGYLTCDDVAVCVVYGRTMNDYEKCVGKILSLRNGDAKEMKDVIDALEDLCTPRRWKGSDDLLWERGIDDIGHIANTAMNFAFAAGLIDKETQMGSRSLTYRLTEDPDVLADMERWLAEADKIEKITDDESTWINAQNRFGRYDRDKVISIGAKPKTDGLDAVVQAAYIAAVGDAPYGFDHAAFVAETARRWHKSATEIENLVAKLKVRAPDIERETILRAAASGGKEALLLETGMTNIFRRLGFDKAEHIGQRKPAAKRRGGFPDIYLRSSQAEGSGMADTKATTKYGFALGDTEKLRSYYRNAWMEIDPAAPGRFFLYVAGNYRQNVRDIARELAHCAENYGAPVSAVTVYSLLDLAANEKKPGPEALMKAFEKGAFYNSDSQIIAAAETA